MTFDFIARIYSPITERKIYPIEEKIPTVQKSRGIIILSAANTINDIIEMTKSIIPKIINALIGTLVYEVNDSMAAS